MNHAIVLAGALIAAGLALGGGVVGAAFGDGLVEGMYFINLALAIGLFIFYVAAQVK